MSTTIGLHGGTGTTASIQINGIDVATIDSTGIIGGVVGKAASGANADITSLSALTAPTVSANPVRAGDEQIQLTTAFTTGGSSIAFTLTPTPATTSNAANQRFRVKFNAAAGATPTLAVSGQIAKSLKYYDSAGAKQAITSTQVPINWISDIEYDGTDWVVLDIPPAIPGNDNSIQDFRLTLTTGLAVTTADVIGATTIYCTPYAGNRIALHDGVNWNIRTSAGFSLALGILTSDKPYDVFCYDNGGVPTLELRVWTNDTTRATALVYQDGVLCSTDASTRRYLGTFYTTSTTQTEDSAVKRYLWNYYHRVVRKMYRQESVASWTYTAAAWRQANANAANQIAFIRGVSEDAVNVQVSCTAQNTNVGVNFAVAMGLDGITPATTRLAVPSYTVFAAGGYQAASAILMDMSSAGRHYYTWLEYSDAVGVTTWLAYSGDRLGGIQGSLMA